MPKCLRITDRESADHKWEHHQKQDQRGSPPVGMVLLLTPVVVMGIFPARVPAPAAIAAAAAAHHQLVVAVVVRVVLLEDLIAWLSLINYHCKTLQYARLTRK
jgi:hypothetical protein